MPPFVCMSHFTRWMISSCESRSTRSKCSSRCAMRHRKACLSSIASSGTISCRAGSSFHVGVAMRTPVVATNLKGGSTASPLKEAGAVKGSRGTQESVAYHCAPTHCLLALQNISIDVVTNVEHCGGVLNVQHPVQVPNRTPLKNFLHTCAGGCHQLLRPCAVHFVSPFTEARYYIRTHAYWPL